MQPQCTAGSIAADLQHLACRDRDRWTAAVVGGVLVWDQRVQRVVAAAKVYDNESTRWDPLRLRDCAQESGRGKTESNRRNAVTNEDSSRYAHESLLSTPAGTRRSRREDAQGPLRESSLARSSSSPLRIADTTSTPAVGRHRTARALRD